MWTAPASRELLSTTPSMDFPCLRRTARSWCLLQTVTARLRVTPTCSLLIGFNSLTKKARQDHDKEINYFCIASVGVEHCANRDCVGATTRYSVIDA